MPLLRPSDKCFLASALVLAIAFLGCGSNDSDDDVNRGEVSLLFVVNAEGGTLEPVSGRDGLSLTLRDLDANVTAFSDRPKRITFSMNPEAFFSRWKKAFGADRPNAALDLASLDRARSKTRSGDARVVVLELGRPRFRGETATFAARRLNELSPGLAHYGGLTDGESPRRFEEASLFIDAAGNDDAVQVFAINYNVLRGMGGMGGLGD